MTDKVLTHVFEVATVKRCAGDIHARPEHDILTAEGKLLAYRVTIELGQRRVPRGRQAGE